MPRLRLSRHIPSGLALVLLGLGASASESTAAATCPDDAKLSDARVQLWSEPGCEGSTVSVGFDPAASERPDFTVFTDVDGDVTWFDTKTSSLAVAAGSCVRLFEHAGHGGSTYPLACAGSGTQYVASLGAFDNHASSMRVCGALMPSDCDPPAAAPAAGPAPPAPADCAAAATTPGLQLSVRPRSVITTRFGRSRLIGGRLTRSDGSPIAGATLCAETKSTAPGARARIAGTVTADAGGRFSYRVSARSSRRVTFVFKGGEGAVSGSVLVRVRAPVSLRASERALRNGEVLGLRGRAPRGSRRGLLVELQARRAGRWQTFGTARTRPSGRFRFAYRFTRTFDVRVYRLRARVPFQPTLPFAPGASRVVRVRVAG